MAFSAFPYIGGKTSLCDWVIDNLPDHDTYIEPFGGSAAVLLNKPRSAVEVFNDLDSDVVTFFDIARRRPDELIEWCQRTPFSQELHDEWTNQFYSGERPEDDIARAGRWLFLRYSQYAGKVASPSGFKRETSGDKKGAREARNWSNVPERIERVADRFAGVSLLNEDFHDVVDRYDSNQTVFYVDPPYLDKENLYHERADHAELASVLNDCDGCVLLSYTEYPADLYSGWTVLERSTAHNAGATGKEVTERLICNFDPQRVYGFVSDELSQQRLGAIR